MSDYISKSSIKITLKDLADHLDHAYKAKGHHEASSLHEVWGIIDEEFKEFKIAVHHRKFNDAQKELLDIAVSALHGYATLVNISRGGK